MSITQKELIIVKLDAIGDYILFRNYLKDIKESGKYRNYNITLVGNLIWRNIAEKFDSEYISEFFWINKSDLNNFEKIKEKNKLLFEKKFDVLVHPTYSRLKKIDDLVNMIQSNEKIAYRSDNSNQIKKDLKVTDSYYTKLLETPHNSLHEFERHKFFFEFLLENKTTTELFLPFRKESEEEYAVLFPGANSKFRRWPIKKFIKIANYLNNVYYLNIKICGSADDCKISDKIQNNTVIPTENLAGKTDITDLIEIIGNSKILITNDTSALHIGAATKTKTVLISSGHTKDRFAEYGYDYIKKLYPLFYIQKLHGLIFTIRVRSVKKKIDELLK